MSHLFSGIFLSIAVISAAGCSGSDNDSLYEKINPDEGSVADVYFENPVIKSDRPDPTIWKNGYSYYTLSTGVNHYIWTSYDLVNWKSTDIKPHSADDAKEAQKTGSRFWAPDMIKIGKYWNLYISLYNAADDSGIGLFRSESPTGPFAWCGVVTHSKTNGGIIDTIDPEVVKDPDTGKIWLFFGSTGKMFRVELNEEGTALAGNASYTHVAGLHVSLNPSRSSVFEGAYVYRRGDWWYLFASAGLYSNSTYKLVVGRSKSLLGEFVDKEGRKMTEGYASDLIVSGSGDAFYGPGHNGEIFTDMSGQDYIIYHCHNESINASSSQRYLMLQRLFWDEEGWPYVEGGKPAAKDIAPKLPQPYV